MANVKSAIEQLDKELQLVANGAHAHAVNKARFYLKDEKAAKIILPLVRRALASGDWSVLRARMKRWF